MAMGLVPQTPGSEIKQSTYLERSFESIQGGRPAMLVGHLVGAAGANAVVPVTIHRLIPPNGVVIPLLKKSYAQIYFSVCQYL